MVLFLFLLPLYIINSIKNSARLPFFTSDILIFLHPVGALAQLARAFDWQSRGHRFDSDMLHLRPPKPWRRRDPLAEASYSGLSPL